MAFRQDEPVPVFPFRIFRIDIHFTKVAGSYKISDGKRTTGMTRLSFINHGHGFFPQVFRNLFQFLFCSFHAMSPRKINNR